MSVNWGIGWLVTRVTHVPWNIPIHTLIVCFLASFIEKSERGLHHLHVPDVILTPYSSYICGGDTRDSHIYITFYGSYFPRQTYWEFVQRAWCGFRECDVTECGLWVFTWNESDVLISLMWWIKATHVMNLMDISPTIYTLSNKTIGMTVLPI